MGKKKKRDESEVMEVYACNGETVSGDSHDTKQKKKKKKRKNKTENEKDDARPKERPTISIAVPGSIVDNAQSLELATRLAGQIARAAVIFRIDEVVVFDNKSSSETVSGVATVDANADDDESGAAFLIRILQYLETPQYLRRSLFPKHNNLRFVGLLPPLDAPHHLRKHEWGSYREGVTLKDQAPSSAGTLVDVGLSKLVLLLESELDGLAMFLSCKKRSTEILALSQDKDLGGVIRWNVVIDEVLDSGVRVTVAMGTNRNLNTDVPRQVVSPSKPREAGIYWGYKVRYASNMSSVFKDSPYKVGYDYVIGTSEHGQFVKSSELSLPAFRHLLIAFGGLAGLEESIEEDSSLKGKKAQEVFISYLNTCPNQGSRTIRTEEAIFISLQYFQEPISRALQ